MSNDIILKGNNFQRWIAILIALILILISLLKINEIGFLALFPAFIGLIILLLIQFPKIIICQNKILHEKTGLIKIFNVKEIYDLREIEKVQFEKGDELRSSIFIQLFYRNGGFGPRTKSDQLILSFKNGKIKILQRINSRERFKEFIGIINENLKKYST
ncbi:MAG: hypothetical protein KDC52_00200 [Ignavibacteriae bacterium]|nr:hypothetical protein [Ignavibacteriota bacterium]